MFKDIAIDWGGKRIGLAWGNPENGLVIPGKIVSHAELWQVLADRIADQQVNRFVLGRPLNFFLQPTEVTQQIIDFSVILNQRFPYIAIEWQEERGTSQGHDQKGNIDDLAAAKILRRFYGENE
jgi:RNase H-fold protein (predicted Holliday junction resolvase)